MDSFDSENDIQNSLDNITKDERSIEPDWAKSELPNETAEEQALYRPSNKGGGDKKNKRKGLAKKFGPVGVVFSILSGAFIGFNGLMTPAIAINHFATAVNNKFSTQDVFMNRRLTETTTTKLKNDKAGKEIDVGTDNPYIQKRQDRLNNISPALEKRVNQYAGDKDAYLNMIEQDDGTGYFTNFDIRQVTNLLTKGRHGTSADKVVATINKYTGAIRMGLGTVKLGAKAVDWMKRKMDSNISGQSESKPFVNKTPDLSSASKNYPVEAAEAEVSEIKSGGNSRKATTGKLTKGAAITGKAIGWVDRALRGATKVCEVYNIMASVNRIVKMDNALQLIRFAITFFTTADRIKAGVATEEETSYIGNLLLEMIDSVGGTTKTAMDSTGFLYASQGAISQEITAETDPSAAQFQNAASGETARLLSTMRSGDGFCDFMTDGRGAIVGALLGVASVLLAAFTGGLSLAAFFTGSLIGFVGNKALDAIVAEIADSLGREVAASITGFKVSSETGGEDFGNAVTAGIGNHQARVSAHSGGGVLSKDAANAVFIANDAMIAMRASDERATRSPFDASSPYTFLGSIIFKAWPYRSKTVTTMGKISSLFGLAKNFLNDLIPSSHALAYANTKFALSQCKDPDYVNLSEEGVAAFDIFCNPIHGIPIAALFNNRQATAMGINSPSVLVAETNSTGRAPEFVGEHFTQEKVLAYINKENSDNKFFDKNGRVVKNNDNPLWLYYQTCVNRGLVPFGSTFSKRETNDGSNDKKQNNTVAALLGIDSNKLVGSGEECVITNDPLMNSNEYTENGRRVMFALFFADERAQCILDDDEGCMDLEATINPTDAGSSEGWGGSAGRRLWPLAKSTTVTQKFGVNGSKGITIAAEVNENVLAVANGTAQVSRDQGAVSISIKSDDSPGQSFVYTNLSEASISDGAKVSIGQVIGKTRATNNSSSVVTAEQIGQVIQVGDSNILVQYEDDESRIKKIPYGGLEKIEVAQGQAVNKGDILGYKKPGNTAHLFFQFFINGKPVDPMSYLTLGGGIASLSGYSVVNTSLSVPDLKTLMETRNLKQTSDHCLGVANFYAQALTSYGQAAGYNIATITNSELSSLGNSPGYGKASDICATNPDSDKRTLKLVYDKLKANLPVVLKVSAKGGRHYVAVVGMRSHINSADQLTANDLVYFDPTYGNLTNNTITGRRLYSDDNKLYYVGAPGETNSTTCGGRAEEPSTGSEDSTNNEAGGGGGESSNGGGNIGGGAPSCGRVAQALTVTRGGVNVPARSTITVKRGESIVLNVTAHGDCGNLIGPPKKRAADGQKGHGNYFKHKTGSGSSLTNFKWYITNLKQTPGQILSLTYTIKTSLYYEIKYMYSVTVVAK